MCGFIGKTIKIRKINKSMKLKKHFDIVIANPPYGKIGAQITKRILEEVAYEQYINLLPANDYKRVPELWNYIISMVPVKDGFVDAAVTTHIADISKNKVNNWSKEDFEVKQYIQTKLIKYLCLNNTKKHYALDTAKHEQTDLSIDTKCTYVFGHRDLNHGYLPYKGINYRYNYIEDIDIKYMIENSSNDNYYVKFKTPVEKQNFRSFLSHNNAGYLFFKYLCYTLNVDSHFSARYFPKVDWTKSWTVEEILKEYNYTDGEIEEVIKDLGNFGGMKDESKRA